MRRSNFTSNSLGIQPECVFDSPTLETGARGGPEGEQAGFSVLMSIRLDSRELASLRRVLHKLLGPDLDIYAAVIDNKNGCAILQLKLAADRVAETMSMILRTLPEAEFGLIRRSLRSSSR